MKWLFSIILICFLALPSYANIKVVGRYTAEVLSVYDGDTATMVVNLGLGVMMKESCRFFGIDTPEIRTKDKAEKAEGLMVRDFVKSKIEGKTVIIEVEKRGKFGRPLVTIYYEDGKDLINLNKQLVDEGMAKEYFGGKRN